jgi:hypothetical protein
LRPQRLEHLRCLDEVLADPFIGMHAIKREHLQKVIGLEGVHAEP